MVPPQPLLTDKALSLSLSAPRAPPLGSDQRKKLQRSNIECNRQPHPHLPTSTPFGDRLTRQLGRILPVSWQNTIRDSGVFRWIADSLVLTMSPVIAITAPPKTWSDAVRLTRSMKRISYGEHPSQSIDLYFPQNESKSSSSPTQRLVVFVHGGAWGSGKPFMYRLVAATFTNPPDPGTQTAAVVAVVGYRTYPCSVQVDDQVNDCERAIELLAERFPDLCQNMLLVGHSSGAHVSLLLLVERAKQQLADFQTWKSCDAAKANIQEYIGLSGPYDISQHFHYEAARGVEETSPMKAVNGFSHQAFRSNSPAFRLASYLGTATHHIALDQLSAVFPSRMLLVHGIEDDTVPFTATAEVALKLRQCGITQIEEEYLGSGTGHQDTVVHLMLGGDTKDALLVWLHNRLREADQPRSKL